MKNLGRDVLIYEVNDTPWPVQEQESIRDFHEYIDMETLKILKENMAE